MSARSKAGMLLGDARHGESVAGDVLGGDEDEHHLVLLVGDRDQVDQAPERGAWTMASSRARVSSWQEKFNPCNYDKSAICRYLSTFSIIHFKTKRTML